MRLLSVRSSGIGAELAKQKFKVGLHAAGFFGHCQIHSFETLAIHHCRIISWRYRRLVYCCAYSTSGWPAVLTLLVQQEEIDSEPIVALGDHDRYAWAAKESTGAANYGSLACID